MKLHYQLPNLQDEPNLCWSMSLVNEHKVRTKNQSLLNEPDTSK